MAGALAIGATACGDDDDGDDTAATPDATPTAQPKDPDTAEEVTVDRFSAEAGTLMVRDGNNGLPAAGAAIDFDQGAPFITRGLGPEGNSVQYYNFDVQSSNAIPIYVLFRDGEDSPVDGQLNIVDAVPGDGGYSDFWLVTKVTVPADYVANVVTSAAEIRSAGYPMETTTIVVNCPIVPDGSTASLRVGGGSAALARGWYRGEIVYYFSFEEAPITATGSEVPTSPIYVEFNINPDQENGGPPSGFKTEKGTDQTHNVVATLPGDNAYSPLWSVNVIDNADFDSVSNLDSAEAATILATGVANVNCPIVSAP